MNMKTIKMGLAAAGAATALSVMAITESIAYSGTVRNADGTPFTAARSMAMTFRIYDALNPEAALWARTIPVRVETDGSFSVELSDKNGTSAMPKDQPDVPLGRACASVCGSVQIGLTLPDPMNPKEFRETLRSYPAVDHAAFAENTPVARLNTLRCESLSVYGSVRVDEDLLVSSENKFGKQVVLDVAPNETAEFHGGYVQFKLAGWETLEKKDDRAYDRIATVSRTTTCDSPVRSDESGYGALVPGSSDAPHQTVQIPHNVFGAHGQGLDVPTEDCTLEAVQTVK